MYAVVQKQLQSVEREMKHHEMRHAQNSKVLDQLKSGKLRCGLAKASVLQHCDVLPVGVQCTHLLVTFSMLG